MVFAGLVVVGTTIGVALLALGVWIGRMLTRSGEGQVIVGWREFWRFGRSGKYQRNRKSYYVVYGTIAVIFGLAHFFFSSITALAIAVGIGIIFGATLNSFVRT